ncbi:MAG: hypothetical protein JNL87_12400 [Burkholderiaceae bacterium]|nr:hypothetical protein [Burkholderiaceae bacterium]
MPQPNAIFSSLASGLLAASLCTPAAAIVVDTGPGFDIGGGYSLYDDRPITTGYQRLAARFTLGTSDLISSVQGWLNWDYGGWLTFSVWSDFQGLPGGRLHSVSAPLAATGPNRPDWRGVGGLGWLLPAGDFWLVFEDARDPGSGAMPGGAPSPLTGYASGPGLLGAEWLHADTLGFGVRINVLPEPPPAPVPEPSTTWLWIAGAAGLALGRWRSGRSSAG